jgi:C4-dicarboxylate transporter DctM subunit
MHGLILTGLILVLIIFRQPIVLIVGAALAYVHVFMTASRPEFLIQDMWIAVDREVLLSIPLFVFAGLIMARGSIAKRLTRIMTSLTGSFPGGLAVATVLSLTAFGAICGASAVTMLAIGTIMYPALLANGYPKGFSLGLLCAGGTLGVIIPPSLLMILYGIMTEVSITKLFLAGWGPGLLLAALLSVYSVAVNWRIETKPFSGREVVDAMKSGIWAILMPVILLGGIYTGWFTVTEAAAVSVVYAIAVEFLIHRELSPRAFAGVVMETIKLQGSLMPLLAIAVSLNNVLDLEGVPQALVAFMRVYIDSKFSLLVVTNLVLLIAGALMDESSAIIVLAPLLAPLGQSYGFDDVHFGIITIVNLQIGYVAPPVALNLIVAMVAFKEPFGFICRSVVPFIGIMLIGLVITCAFPELSLFLIK